MFRRLVTAWKLSHRRRTYRPGATITHFIARDIRRDVRVIDAAGLAAGVIIAEVRTWNVLYATHGIAEEPPFSPPKRVEIDQLWKWTGAISGGPVPENDIARA